MQSPIVIPDRRRKSMPDSTLTKQAKHILVFLPLVLAVGCVAASMPGDRAAQQAGSPIAIERQGSFFVAGKKLHTETGNDGDAKSVQNPGSATIHQMYVQYQIPAQQKYKLPIIMMHGGGHTGAVYESTPDGRDGWATYFLRKGFSVYVVDGVNRGRSGYDITDVSLVRQGANPGKNTPLINRYSHERAWTQFRFGPKIGVLNPNSQFPAEAFNQYTAQLVPAWRDDAEIDRNIEGLIALLDRIGPAVVLTWSQSGLFGWRAALARPNLVKAIISCEPSMISPEGVSTGLKPADLKALASVPIVIQVGDYDPPRLKSLKSFASSIGPNVLVLSLPELGIYGNSHLVMIEKNNLQVADLFIQRLEKILPGNVQ
jgi:pimeloyl-ACP methyl ester carboxylesterase